MAKKKAPPELSAPVIANDVVTSGELFLYRAGEGDSLRCCFCPKRIEYREIYIIFLKLDRRRAHFSCVNRVLEEVIAIRDKKGKSEDL